MPKCDFNKVVLHIFRTPFNKSAMEGIFYGTFLHSADWITAVKPNNFLFC